MKAIWKGHILAESDDTIRIEGNHYFPPSSVQKKFFKQSNTTTVCPWKGIASYYNIEINGESNQDAAWYYPQPKEAANAIKDYIAFWKGVKVE
ncbi:DUF427 domain-containing protein [Rapidithrix thailandica]|uniref:DUF427 domain-containing protein n=1 Tax=Rapidithrix thailandica TaxID=413964 RepID=A0AAW9RTF3_9BACT